VANTEVERHTRRDIPDVEEVPSAEWGWSKENHRWIHIGGLLSAAFLLLLLRGNHVGHIEDFFLIGFAALLVIVVARDWWLRRRGWIR
jgi:Protein of unknown function (DUF2631)